MSRVAKSPVKLPSGVEVSVKEQELTVKGSKGSLQLALHNLVELSQEDGAVSVRPTEESQIAWALAGTTRSLVNNMVTGVSAGFEQKLELVGVGYKAQAQGLSLIHI